MTPERCPSPQFWATSSLQTPWLPDMFLSRVDIPEVHLLSVMDLENASWISSEHQNLCLSGITNIYNRENVNLEIYIFVCLPPFTALSRPSPLPYHGNISNLLTWLVMLPLSLETSFGSLLPSVYIKQTNKQNTKLIFIFDCYSESTSLPYCPFIPPCPIHLCFNFSTLHAILKTPWP